MNSFYLDLNTIHLHLRFAYVQVQVLLLQFNSQFRRRGLHKDHQQPLKMTDLRYYLEDAADPRAKDLFLMSGPSVPVIICSTYLYLIYSYVPKFMKSRPAYDLRIILRVYNLFQMAICSVVIYGIVTSGWTTKYEFLCEPIDYSNDPLALRMLKFVWLTMLVKIIDLTETIFFLLRKKDNQVSPLHVYHHISTFLFLWVATKYIGGGALTMFIILNNSVHVLMYFYYFLSSFGPEMQKKLIKWKPRLTTVQLIQFALITAYTLQGLRPSCNTPKFMAVFFLPNMYVISKMFWDFYQNSYLKKRKT